MTIELVGYSTTAANNNSAVPNGAPEGWFPPQVNNVVREIMAGIKREYADRNGSLSSAGGTTAYTLAINSTTTAAAAGEFLVFKINATNTGAVTINITPSGGAARGAVAVQKDGFALVAGEWKIGNFAAVLYDGTQYQLVTISPDGWHHLSTQTASASATLDFTTGISSTYDLYKLVLTNLKPATDAVDLYIQTSTDAGATWDAGTGYAYNTQQLIPGTAALAAAQTSAGDAQMNICNSVGNDTNEALNATVYFWAPSATSIMKFFKWDATTERSDGTYRLVFGFGLRDAAADVDGVRVRYSSGNLASGTAALYGLKK